MLSSSAAVMTFGCRPPVSHGLAANADRAAGRRPRLRSVCQPPLLVYTEKVIYKIPLPVELNCRVSGFSLRVTAPNSQNSEKRGGFTHAEKICESR